MRNGSYTSSTVSVGSPTAMASVDRPTGPPPKRSHSAREHRPVDLVEAALVHPEGGQAGLGRVVVDGAVAAHLGEVAHPAQQAVGDAGRAPGPPGDLAAPVGVDRHLEDAGRPLDDGLEIGRVVVVEPGDEPEAVAQRPGDQAGAGGGADQGEAGDVEPDRAGGRALAQHDVELEVLHRRVEHLFDGPGQPVDLVDEEHVALAELAEDGGEVAAPLERRTGRDVQADVHLGGDDVGEAGLAEAGRAGEEEVVGGLPRRRAASRMIARCSLSSAWPTKSSSRRGRRPISVAASTSSAGSGSSSSSRTVASLSARPRRAGAAPP